MEILSPAGSYEIAKNALLTNSDAVYLATSSFNARQNAKNLTMDELKDVVRLAHLLDKKVYVTVNVLIKEKELEDCYNYIDELYKIGVDAIIAQDLAIINYVIKNYNDMDLHVSTQAGIKNLNDALFFEKIGAKRIVIAREASFEEIKKIKDNTKLEVEVFIHGALCVSYSGACYISSYLKGLSANRGMCKQNCRHTYRLIADDFKSDELKLLSMKDLNTIDDITKLKEIGVDSFKIEGRMKNLDYVIKTATSYKNKLNGINKSFLNEIFHRTYTKGFLFKTDLKDVVYSKRTSSEGIKLGAVKKLKDFYYLIENKNNKIMLNDKLRLENNNDKHYILIDELFDTSYNKVKFTSSNFLIRSNLKLDNFTAYKTITDENITFEYEKYIPLSFKVFLLKDQKLKISCNAFGKWFEQSSISNLEPSINQELDYDTLYKQINKFDKLPFKISKLEIIKNDNLFIRLKEINEVRRKLIEQIINYKNPKRILKERYNEVFLKLDDKKNIDIVCRCLNKDQEKAINEFDNIILFNKENTNSYFNDEIINTNSIYIESYSNLLSKSKYKMTSSLFNIANKDSLYFLLKNGATKVSLSKELSKDEVNLLLENFIKKYKFIPNTSFNFYGKEELMYLKYCPISHMNLCGMCNKKNFYLQDEHSKFLLIHDKCNTILLNEKTTNILNKIDEYKYIKGITLSFTTETYNETKKIISELLKKFNNKKDISFDSKNDTLGYYKREMK